MKLLILAMILLLTGCSMPVDEVVGTWNDKYSDRQYVFTDDGECVFNNNSGIGNRCTWRRNGEIIEITVSVSSSRVVLFTGEFTFDWLSIYRGGAIQTIKERAIR